MEESREIKKIILYADLISQPARAVYNLLRLNKLDFQLQSVLLYKKEHKSEAYLKINPHGLVPAIKIVLNNQNEEIILYESATIMRFICQKFNLPQNWYSHKEENLVRRSLIDQYLDWHHGNTRRILATSVRNEFFIKKESTRKEFDRLFQYLESELGKHLYIIDDEISIADLLLYNELIELSLIQYDFDNYPFIKRYIQKISQLEEVRESNFILEKVLKLNQLKPNF